MNEFGQTPGDGEEQGSPACCSSRGQSPHNLVTEQLQVTKESIFPGFLFSIFPCSFHAFHEESDFRTDYFFQLGKHAMP